MYLKILLHVIAFGFAGAVFGALWFPSDRGGDTRVFIFLGTCTGILLGAIFGGTRCVLQDLPHAIERAMFVRKIRNIDRDWDEPEERE
jgi:hypothetical protein